VQVRKQVYELTPDDLASFPVWEFCLDEEGVEGQDEATVRPYEKQGSIDPAAGMFAVKALFTLADNTEFTGYLTPPVLADREDIGIIQPIIVTDKGQLMFWNGLLKPTKTQLDENYGVLDKSASEVFPVRYRSAVEIEGGAVEGTIDGFLYCRKKKLRRDYVVELVK
jgi:hypothetical protein